MKRLIKIVSLFVMAIIFSLCLTACDPHPYIIVKYSDEYFEYELLEPKIISYLNEPRLYIVGLTEKGKQQTHLIIPNRYRNYKVEGIGYQEDNSIWVGSIVGDFRSTNLEKLYMDCDIVSSYNWAHSEVHDLPNCYVVFWHTDSAMRAIPRVKGEIYGYNYYISEESSYFSDLKKIGNVSYLYNYDGSENDGYYWVDSYDESVITFIPPEPQRDGYIFDGWYKESECVNEWDFETDITGKEIIIEEDRVYDTYEGIYLYAKWIKN